MTTAADELAKIPFVESILCLSDFSAGSEPAFDHALAIALPRRAKLTLLHATTQQAKHYDWREFPSVRSTLEGWGMLAADSPRAAVFNQLGLKVEKVQVGQGNPHTSILTFLERHGADLLVLGTERREGLARLLKPSFAESFSRKSRTLTLFVPSSVRGFVAHQDGKVTLNRILVPVDHQPSPNRAIAFATRAAALAFNPDLEASILHMGHGAMPQFELPQIPVCNWQTLQRQGDVVGTILKTAREDNVDLIVMATQGHHGILDAFRGSVTEQILRHSPCPVLAVPTL